MTDELARLEREIAEETASRAVCQATVAAHYTHNMVWAEVADSYAFTKHTRYLELRGLLERHPEKPELVRFAEKEHE